VLAAAPCHSRFVSSRFPDSDEPTVNKNRRVALLRRVLAPSQRG
jgi:hypothetical protein